MGNVKRNEPSSFEEMEELAEGNSETTPTQEKPVPEEVPSVEKTEDTE